MRLLEKSKNVAFFGKKCGYFDEKCDFGEIYVFFWQKSSFFSKKCGFFDKNCVCFGENVAFSVKKPHSKNMPKLKKFLLCLEVQKIIFLTKNAKFDWKCSHIQDCEHHTRSSDCCPNFKREEGGVKGQKYKSSLSYKSFFFSQIQQFSFRQKIPSTFGDIASDSQRKWPFSDPKLG